jgi:hypothetical protein
MLALRCVYVRCSPIIASLAPSISSVAVVKYHYPMTDVFTYRTVETTQSRLTGAKSGSSESDTRAINHRKELRAKLRQELRNEVAVADPLSFIQS